MYYPVRGAVTAALLFVQLLAATSKVAGERGGQQDHGQMTCETNKDESLTCKFTTKRPLDGNTVGGKEATFEDCPIGSDVCITAQVKVKDHPIQESNNVAAHAGADGTIKVLEATYRPPFSKYGRHISRVLNNLPRGNHFDNWASWYLELGAAHFTTATSSLEGEGIGVPIDWYQMELALNAYRQSIAAMDEDPRTKSERDQQEYDLFMAAVHFQVGEVYHMHPDGEKADDALAHFEKSWALWEDLRQAKPLAGLIDHADLETRWANTSVRLSNLLVEKAGHHEPTHLMDMMMSPNPEEKEFAQNSMDEIERAERLITGAIYVYEKPITEDMSMDDIITCKMNLGSSFQTAAAIATIKQDLPLAVKRLQKVLQVFRDEILSIVEQYSPDADEARTIIADVLLSLADTQLQRGKYDSAREYYRQAMAWHEKYNVPMAPVVNMVDDDVLDVYETVLREYQQSINGEDVLPPEDVESIYEGTLNDQEGYYYGKDDGYEADLRSALGGVHLAHEQIDLALEYFYRAVELYESAGQAKDRPMADVKLDLAMALLRARRFQESMEAQSSALDIYQELYGEDVNPFVQGIDDLSDYFGVPFDEEKTAEAEGIKSRIIDIDRFKRGIHNFTQSPPTDDADTTGMDEL